MKLNRKWLHEEFVDLSHVSDREYVEKLTVFGQKVETWERMDSEIKNVVVGKVLEIVRHENSDHMWVCQIDVGEEEPVQIVTGAQNVKIGDMVPVAKHNSWLPGGVHITKGKLRGVKSNGMLCGLEELGLTQGDFPYAILDGIFIIEEECTIGQDINEIIGNDDTIVEFEITNNRPDCYSVIGLARESAAAFGRTMKHHEPVVKGSDAGSIFEHLDVEVPAEHLCNRYSSRMVANVKIGPSPKWLRQRLRANGVRPINNIVDITNYVMLEYGQPMHAFDYRYVSSGKIVVREAEEGETLTTLDGNVRNLKPGMLVIADESKPIGLAGIMGGENSEILDDTTTVVFESANFNGTSIRQTALALGMRTESSGKFEKNLDPMMTVPAVQRACELVELLECGDVLDGIIDIINYVPQPKELPLEVAKINKLLGTDITREDMVKYLNLLEVEVDGDTIKVPSFRPDLNLMADMAEAIGRDAAPYKQMAAEAKAYMKEQFFNEDGTFKTDILNTMQTPALFALKNNLFDGEAKEKMIARLRENFKQHDNCLQTGFLGTSILMATLTENGMVDIAYELLFQRKNPSWLYSIDNGATTIWERWNSYMVDKGMGPRGMNSFNHYAYGCVCEWIWETAAGIASDPAEPGFKHIIMKPVPDKRLGHLTAEYQSAAGVIKSAWRYEGEQWIWEFTIPEGAKATVTLPGESESKEYGAGTYTVTK